MATRSLFDDMDGIDRGIAKRKVELGIDDEPRPRPTRAAAVDAQELLRLLQHPRFRLLQNINGWVAYSKSDDPTAFRFGAGKDPITALRMSLGIKE